MLSAEEFGRFLDMNKAKMGVKRDAELCRAVKISSQQLYHYRKLPSSISIATLSRICNFLRVPVEERGRLLQ